MVDIATVSLSGDDIQKFEEVMKFHSGSRSGVLKELIRDEYDRIIREREEKKK